MGANIEFKARVRDLGQLHRMARNISASPAQIIDQEDIFFHVPTGRLKLRVLGPDRGELIAYERPDQSAARLSSYRISQTTDPEGLRQVLTAALGVRGIVKKRRTLYLVGQTRIHLDQVEGLGDFVELEYVLEPREDPSRGEDVVEQLKASLGIKDADLLAQAYIDLLESST